MAHSGPFVGSRETDALFDFFQLLVAAGTQSRDPHTLSLPVRERWALTDLREKAKELPRESVVLLSRYGWRRTNNDQLATNEIRQLGRQLAEAGTPLSQSQMRLALLAGAFWCEADEQGSLQNLKSLESLEEFNNLVNGYLQSLPKRISKHSSPDIANLYFRAYQRRRYGMDTNVRSPQILVKRLKMDVQNMIDTYADQLFYESRSSARKYAASIAVALGRPLDETIVSQLEITLATAIGWRHMNHLPEDNSHDPLIGPRTPANELEWEPISQVILDNRAALSNVHGTYSDPAVVHAPSLVSVGGEPIDGQSLAALQVLDDYVHNLATWILQGPGRQLAPEERLGAFDREFRRPTAEEPAITTGAHIIETLPQGALRVIANVDALQVRNRSAESVSNELAMALGEASWAKRFTRSLSVAASWLNGELSPIEQAHAEVVIDLERLSKTPKQEDLTFLSNADQKDAEALLDLGASIAELVRFSRSINNTGVTPVGWWKRFHEQQVGNIPTSKQLLERLPDQARSILHKYIGVLRSPHFGDITAGPQALAQVLGRESDALCVRTLAVALSAGSIWNDIRTETTATSDTLLGIDSEHQGNRILYARAQTQLQWGLQELLQSESIVGV